MSLAKVAGTLMVAVGVLLALNAFPLSTVIYPQYFWYELYPGGTSSEPTAVPPGKDVTLVAKLVYYDATAGISLPLPTLWEVRAVVEAGDYRVEVQLELKDFYATTIDSHSCAVSVWEGVWSVPIADGVTYSITWVVYFEDYGSTLQRTTYARATVSAPDGYFRINGQVATATSVIVVDSPRLTLEFIPTDNADRIGSVYVEVFRDGKRVEVVELVRSGTVFTAMYTLPGYGKYTLKGYVKWSGGTLERMSVLLSLDAERDIGIGGGTPTTTPNPTSAVKEADEGRPPLTFAQLAGVGLAALGLVLLTRRRV